MDAFHLPGWEPGPSTRWHSLVASTGDDQARAPVLREDEIRDLIGRIGSARDRVRERPVADIVSAIDAAAGLLADHDAPLHAAATGLLPAFTGYSPAMVRLVLDRMLQDWRAPALERLLGSELGDPRVLDAFRPRPHGAGWTRAFGPDLAFHVFAGNVPGVAVTAIVRALLVKSAVVGKTASGEPVLPVLFARALAEVAPWLADSLAVTYWPGGSSEQEAPLLRTADLVVVYGGAEVVAEVRRRVPASARVVEHGPRVSLGIVGRDALIDDTAAASLAAQVARSVATFDQQGCVSPHVVYVERGGPVEPQRFAELVAHELARVEVELPRGDLSASEAAAIRNLRTAAEFRAAGDPRVVVHAPAGTEFTVVFDPDPGFIGSCLNRFIWVKPLDDAAELPDLIGPFAGTVQSVACEGLGGRLFDLAAGLAARGASRLTTFAALPWPEPEWHHDGAEPLRELLRWVDLDIDAAADPPEGGAR